MSRHLGLFVLSICLLFVSAPAYAGDPEAGRLLARSWCAQCHIVEEEQVEASDVAPPFAQFANDPTKSSAGLTAWLADPHPPMPNLSLSHMEIDNLVAYIETLKVD